MSSKKQRNGEIDILRFIFAIGVVVFHFRGRYSTGRFFLNGYIAVEFFFVLSGFLMAKSAKRALETNPDLDVSKATISFILRKIRSFYPYYVVAIFLQIIINNIIIRHQSLAKIGDLFFRSIPTFSLVFYGTNWPKVALYLGSTWFLSAMIICMFFMYPLLLKWFDLSVKIIIPILSLFLLGYIMEKYNLILHGMKLWDGLVYVGIPKAFAEIGVGVSCLYVPELINKIKSDIFHSAILFDVFLTLLKWICIVLLFLYSFGTIDGNYDLYFLLLCPIIISISFSNAGHAIRGNKLTDLLSNLSLHLFLFHKVILNAFLRIHPPSPLSNYNFLCLVLTTILLTVAYKYLTDLLVWSIGKLRQHKRTASLRL